MTIDANTGSGADFKDRKTGLVVFGIAEIILSVGFAHLAPLMAFSMFAARFFEEGTESPVNVRMLLPGMLTYAVLAVWFIWLGIGSIMARRWARALLLVSSWAWLVTGIISMISMVLFMPDMYGQMGVGGPADMEFVGAIMFVGMALLAVMYVIIPGVLVMFYGSKHVKATCELWDPQIRWTDKCPLPVLALSLVAGLSAAWMPLTAFYRWTIPFFGTVLSGVPGAAVTLLAMLLLGYIAWGMYRLRIKAWWCAVTLIAVAAVSTGTTFSRVSMTEFYESMNFPAEQLEVMAQFSMWKTSSVLLITGLWVAISLAYLVFTRRYFVRAHRLQANS